MNDKIFIKIVKYEKKFKLRLQTYALTIKKYRLFYFLSLLRYHNNNIYL